MYKHTLNVYKKFIYRLYIIYVDILRYTLYFFSILTLCYVFRYENWISINLLDITF